MSQTSFRLPPNLGGKAEPEVVEAIGYHDDAITDLQQAIPALKSQIDALTTSNGAATSTTTNVTTNTETTIIDSNTIGLVNDQTGNSSYTTQQTDYGAFILLSNASPIAIDLAQGTGITIPWFATFINLGAGAATLTPDTGTINGLVDFVLPGNNAVTVSYDGANFYVDPTSAEPLNTPAIVHEWLNSYNSATGAFGQSQPAYSDISGVPTLPATIAAVAHFFLTSYTSGTGAFTAAQPAFTDISGNLATSQLPTAGLSVTITTAKLTTGGANGSMTFTAGVLTAQTPAS